MARAGRHRRRRCQRRALEALLAGPPAGYETEVEPGTKLESFAVADTIATIKLSGRTPVDRGLEQIVATLTDFEDINWVRFGVEEGLVDGTLASGAVDAAPPVELVRAGVRRSETIRFAGTADTFEANVQLRRRAGRQGARLDVRDRNLRLGLPRLVRGHDRRPGPRPGRRSHGHGRRHDGGKVQLEAFTTSAEDGSVQNVVGRDVTRRLPVATPRRPPRHPPGRATARAKLSDFSQTIKVAPNTHCPDPNPPKPRRSRDPRAFRASQLRGV